jgi:hypothetical protein
MFNDLTGTIFADHRFSLPEMVYMIRNFDELTAARIAEELDRSYKSVLEFGHEIEEVWKGDGGLIMLSSESPPNPV